MYGLLAQSGLLRLADQMAAVVYGWGILQDSGSSTAASYVMAASFAALVLGTLAAGRLIAHFGARSVALAGVWLSVGAATAIAAMLAVGVTDPLTIAAVAALGAILDGPASIATETNYPEIARLARFDLMRLNAIDDGLDQTAGLFAPAVGVALVAAMGTGAGAGAVAAFALVAALILTLSLPSFRGTNGTKRAGQTSVRMIARHVALDALLCPLVILLSLVIAVFMTVQLVLIPRLVLSMDAGEEILGLYLFFAAVGGISGAAFAGTLSHRASLRTIVPLSLLVLAAGTGLLLLEMTTLLASASGVLVGLPAGVLSPIAASIFQSHPPKAIRADVLALSGALLYAATPLALLVGGHMADHVAAHHLVAILTALLALLALSAFWSLPTQQGQERVRTARREPASLASGSEDCVRSERSDRVEALDALRGFALFGIVVVNAPFFAGPIPGKPATGLVDVTAVWFIDAFATGKFFLIFSFLFGLGFATALARAEGNREAAALRFLRRLLALFAFGAFNATLLFFGDILMLYAVLGFGLWLCRHWSSRSLLIAASLVFLAGCLVQTQALYELHNAAGSVTSSLGASAGYHGDFGDVIAARLDELPISLGFVVAFNGLPALAMFLAGLALGRSGALALSLERLQAMKIPISAAVIAGGLTSAIAVAIRLTEPSLSAMWIATASLCIAAPVLSFGFAGMMLLAAETWKGSRAIRWLANVGSSSLTGYLMHAMLLGAVFYGWGFGLYGTVGPAIVLAIGVGAFLVITLLLNLWRHFFRYGPSEWLLRSFVDLKWKRFLAD